VFGTVRALLFSLILPMSSIFGFLNPLEIIVFNFKWI
jgi:hypothetical protein